MNEQDKEAFEKWVKGKLAYAPSPKDYENLVEFKDIIEFGWQAACEHKQKEIDNLINASKLEFDKWYSSGMRKEFFEEKRAYDLYYNYTKDVCTYRNLAAVKEKNDALNLAKSYKLLLEKLQAENDELVQQLAVAVGALEKISNDRSPPWDKMDYQSKAREVLKELEEK